MRRLHFATLVALFILLFSPVCPTEAADFVVSPPEDRIRTIYISGPLQSGDDLKFRAALRGVLPLLAIVILESPGGNLHAGLEIGQEIKARAYTTVVKSGAICASACALVWLAGDRRFMAPGAKIGFHAAYADENGERTEKGAPNALIGAYLNMLKLPSEAITYITRASPREIQWLSIESSMRVGINLTVPGENGR